MITSERREYVKIITMNGQPDQDLQRMVAPFNDRKLKPWKRWKPWKGLEEKEAK
jgi:hypothetical protein|tara:strand:+ start:302 stop:463 length:162 start_codon:yes stop_codon:yes gene_type:complete